MDVLLVLASGAIWIAFQDIRLWVLLLALLPYGLRLLAGIFPFRRTPVDWLILLFLVTAWVGYRVSYDESNAWNKFWFVFLAVMLFYALSTQPKQNLFWISVILFVIGTGISTYYFLTHDFIAVPRKLEFVNRVGVFLMSIRPRVGWRPIHPNYVAGIVSVTVPFILYPIWKLRQNEYRPSPFWLLLLSVGLIISVFALIMATSRGVTLAILSAAGTWLLWKLFSSSKYELWKKNKSAFSVLLLIYLCVIVLLMHLGLAQPAGEMTGSSNYGNGSRAEVFSRSAYLLLDYPITGGGLGSFPGLYSQYLLIIPFYYLPNSHNLFLDVAIEQGVIGGLAFAVLYIVSLWSVAGSIARGHGEKVFQWILLFSLVIAFLHGMVDNYLYNGAGSMLSLLLVGLSIRESHINEQVGYRLHPKFAGILGALFLIGMFVYLNQIRSIWYANLGAVQMSQIELNHFPKNRWVGKEIVPDLELAESSLLSSLQYNPNNETANHRLGLISMQRQDFVAASLYLEKARREAPGYRGIIKTLGYCYVWLGNLEKAQSLLTQIPEAKHELEVYIWWWGTQGRPDLSEKAARMAARLDATQ
jgi:O-antigen ligase